MQIGHAQMAANRISDREKSRKIFGQARKPAKMFRRGLYVYGSHEESDWISCGATFADRQHCRSRRGPQLHALAAPLHVVG